MSQEASRPGPGGSGQSVGARLCLGASTDDRVGVLCVSLPDAGASARTDREVTIRYWAASERAQLVQTNASRGYSSSARLPVGLLHAVNIGTGVAACGLVGTPHMFGVWRDCAAFRCCAECARRVPFTN